jgi:arylformamidase
MPWRQPFTMSRLIDLTLTLQPGMRGVEFEQNTTVAEQGWNTKTLHLYSHCGTHMDAAMHFEASPQTIDRVPLDVCCGPAWVVDIPHIQRRALLGIDCLSGVADEAAPGDALLLRTGWSRHAKDLDVYRNQLPRISQSLADWCVERQIRLLGVEPPSVADVNDLEEVTAIHKTLLGGGVTIVEGLTNLESLTARKVLFIALPLKIAAGDGAPCRAMAIDDPDVTFP